MEKVLEYFYCLCLRSILRLRSMRSKSMASGNIDKSVGRSDVSLTVVYFTDITNTIVPIFNKNPIIGIKYYDHIYMV